jgi:hypothetical protein
VYETGTPEERLHEEYLDLVERHGANSPQARDFLQRHREDPGLADLVALVSDMDASRRKAVLTRRAAAGVGMVAALVVASLGWAALQRALAPASAGWGLNQPAALAALETSPSASAYFKGLAQVATQGPERLPDEPLALAQRIGEYRLGCMRVIHSPMRPLGDREKAALHGLCRRWAEQLDNSLEKLDRHAPADQVRAEVTAVIHRIGAKLQEQAVGEGSQ